MQQQRPRKGQRENAPFHGLFPLFAKGADPGARPLFLRLLRGLLNQCLELADAHGDGGSQIGGGLAVLAHGHALQLVHRLAHSVVRQGLGLLVPLLADGAGLAHPVAVAQLVLAGEGGGGIGGQRAGGVEADLGLDGVDDAAVLSIAKSLNSLPRILHFFNLAIYKLKEILAL